MWRNKFEKNHLRITWVWLDRQVCPAQCSYSCTKYNKSRILYG